VKTLGLALLIAAFLGAAPRSAPTIDQSLALSFPSNPDISPDGATVVYQIGRPNWQENAFDADIWLVSLANPLKPRKLNAGPGWNGDAQWSPDGKLIAFLSDRSGCRQVFIISPGGGEARQLTTIDSGINEIQWSPDSQSIAFTADTDPDSHRARTERYGDFEVVKEDRTPGALWKVGVPQTPEAPVSKSEPLVKDTKYSVGGFAFSPDGSRIAFQADGIFSLDLKTKAITKLTSGAGPYRNPVWSPDSSAVAFETAGGDPNFYYSTWYIARVPANGGAVEPLSKDFDENPDLRAWTPSGIYFAALRNTSSHLYRLDPATRKIDCVTGPPDAIDQQFALTPSGDWAAFARSGATDTPEIYASAPGKPAIRLTHGGVLDRFEFAHREVIRWKSADGAEIEGILSKPADFDPHKKYPLLVIIHGGPVAVDQPSIRSDRYYPAEQFVAKGALVLRPNYRGSAGYGGKMRALPVRNLGAGDAADVISGVDYLIGQGFVDPARVGAMGWSEGGYIAAFLGASTNRFAAVSVGAGISDWQTYYSNTDITPFTRQYLKSTPWSDPEEYRKASPVTYINKAHTPVLIQHGDQDRRVPIANAYELRQALEDRNVTVRMIVYKGIGHVIDRPKQQRAVMEQNLEWFDRWVLNAGKKPLPAESVSQAPASRSAGDSQEP
jgi:dipeptidyl aminopeptidase/acylaminoacyl peptidase